ncbi:MAG: aminofutalosine synthase MqnE [Hydrogenobacter thermophilus]|uniref:aminofutalosine synthase MqnE n=1 Tax=Hydrogenobacter thermophilus TaxID=940 RepID=UPI001C775788|nr:aminofutalosine synthase MqnE [Hydrogenobacter thermophilus]QWK20543.1 MAG: aminofutalosine synthase MqnE [Hydrogenobacter thermophilus]
MNIAGLVEKVQDKNLRRIGEKVLKGERLSPEDAIYLFYSSELAYIGTLAEYINRKKNGMFAYFIVNRQINPTNVCIYQCSFCAFGVTKSDPRAYEMSLEDILKKVGETYAQGGREVHIVGGIPHQWKAEDYVRLVREVKRAFPEITVKAWTAIEIHHMSKISGRSYEDILKELKDAGVEVLPGGGAEIFSERVRSIIAPYKANAQEYLEVHRTAHKLGIPTNATMLYGHVETYEERVEHMLKLRELQDETGGFQVFIPLAYWPEGTKLGGKRTSSVDDLKTIAISRLFLDNFEHIKAYWVTLGEKVAQIALNFGADDIDGTIEEEKIVHSAGTKSAYGHSRERLIKLIRDAQKIPVERDTFYRPVSIHS